MKHHPELSKLLRDQYGVVTRQQALAAGVSDRTLRRARAAGEYDVVLPGVLHRVDHPVSFEMRAMAAQLYGGVAGALSGPTAGWAYGLRGMPRVRVWLRTRRASRASLPDWFVCTCSSWLLAERQAIWRHNGWRVLAPAPMLLTLAELFNDHRLERAAEDAWHLGLITPDGVAEFVDIHHGGGRRGMARLGRWLDRAVDRRRPSQSGFEVEVIQALRDAGLPEPVRQHPVTLLSGEVIHLDIAWPDVQLAVEPGHSWWHGGTLRTEADYARDRACGLVGWHVMRYGESARRDLAGLAGEVADMREKRRRGRPPSISGQN